MALIPWRVIMRNILMALFCFSLTFKSYGLVNYSKSNKSQSSLKVRPSKVSKSFSKKSSTRIVFDIESETFTNRISRDKFDLYKFHVGSQISNGIGFYLKTEMGAPDEEGASLGFGNSQFVTMIDWVGGRNQSNASLYVLAGFVLPGSSDGVGHDRNDQMLGLFTQKNFGLLSASASFVHYFLGESENTSLSSYDRAEVKVSYSFSSLVRMGLDVSFISTTGLVVSGESNSFTEYSPYLHVVLGQRSNLKIGAKYSSKNLGAGSFSDFRQWDLGSFTGNSIYASLGFSI